MISRTARGGVHYAGVSVEIEEHLELTNQRRAFYHVTSSGPIIDEYYLVLLLELLRSKLEHSDVSQSCGNLMDGEDVFPLTQQLVPDAMGQGSDQIVPPEK